MEAPEPVRTGPVRWSARRSRAPSSRHGHGDARPAHASLPPRGIGKLAETPAQDSWMPTGSGQSLVASRAPFGSNPASRHSAHDCWERPRPKSTPSE